MADEKPNERNTALREAGDKDAKARDQALEAAVSHIEKEFGAGSLMKLGADSKVAVEAISTGSLPLDVALGVGGVPRGRIVEIFGPESSGKTTLVYHVIAEAQARGGVCAFVDTEHALDPQYARRIGVNTEELLISQPDYGEQALEIVDVLVRSGAVDVVAVDSVAALTPKVELEGQMGEQTVGLQARLMSQALRKLAGNLNRANTTCIFTNQIREKIGVMFGSPETQPGGRALKFYSSQRLDIRRIETLKEGTEAVGNRVRVKVVKNKVAPPFKQAEFDIEYGQGISKEGGVLDLALEHDLVQKSGSFFSYGETRLGQGRNNVKEFLRDNPEMRDDLESQVYEKLGAEAKVKQDAIDARKPKAVPDPPPEVETEAEKALTPSPPTPRPLTKKPRRPPRQGQEGRVGGRVAREPDGYELALKALGRKERTAGEIEGLLRDRGVGDEELRGVLEQLIDAGLVDDARFARLFAEDKRALRGWGPDRIEEALRARGVDGSTIADAVDSETPDELVDRAVELLAAGGYGVEDEAAAWPGAGFLGAAWVPARNRAMTRSARWSERSRLTALGFRVRWTSTARSSGTSAARLCSRRSRSRSSGSGARRASRPAARDVGDDGCRSPSSCSAPAPTRSRTPRRRRSTATRSSPRRRPRPRRRSPPRNPRRRPNPFPASPRAASRPARARRGRDPRTLAVNSPDDGSLVFDPDGLDAEPGSVTLAYANPSIVAHNIAIEDGSGEVIAESEDVTEGEVTIEAELVPGAYTYFCSIPGHREGGMEGTLTVDAESATAE